MPRNYAERVGRANGDVIQGPQRNTKLPATTHNDNGIAV